MSGRTVIGRARIAAFALLVPACLLTSPLDEVNRTESEADRERSTDECQDLWDNDGDGAIDCEDDGCCGVLFCRDFPVCQSGGAEQERGAQCGNGRDDDEDGFTDCQDQSCCFSEACGVTPICAAPEPGEESGDEMCLNGVDDDDDGAADCADPSCCLSYECQLLNPGLCGGGGGEYGLACEDGADNDENGFADCDDPSCCGEFFCETSLVCSGTAIACPADLAADLASSWLIDDFEDGDDFLPIEGERDGYWALLDSGGGIDETWIEYPPDGYRGAAMLITPGNYGEIAGVSLVVVDTGDYYECAYGLGRFQGIRFAYRGRGRVRFNVRTADVTPIYLGGVCDDADAGCFNVHGVVLDLSGEWNERLVFWDDLRQEPGWGVQTPFNPDHVMALEFIVEPEFLGDYELWIDEMWLE